MKYFVWVNSFCGIPEGQIWYEMQTGGDGKAKTYLACHAIADDDIRNIEKLKMDFRYEAKL